MRLCSEKVCYNGYNDKNISELSQVRRLFFVVNDMKSLDELAEEYLAQADHLKSKLEKLPKITDDYKLKYKRTMYEDMYNEAMSNYYKLRDYYKK